MAIFPDLIDFRPPRLFTLSRVAVIACFTGHPSALVLLQRAMLTRILCFTVVTACLSSVASAQVISVNDLVNGAA